MKCICRPSQFHPSQIPIWKQNGKFKNKAAVFTYTKSLYSRNSKVKKSIQLVHNLINAHTYIFDRKEVQVSFNDFPLGL